MQHILQPEKLDVLFAENDLVQTICGALVEDGLREGYELKAREVEGVEQDEEAACEAKAQCEALGCLQAVREAAIWGRLYGRAGILMIAPGDAASPLTDEAPVVDHLVLDRREMVPLTWYQDPTQSTFGKPETYSVTVLASSGAVASPTVIVHESRILLFGGALTPRRIKVANQGSDLSVIQAPWEILKKAGANFDSMCSMLADMSVGVLKMKGLIDAVAAGRTSQIEDRIELMDASKSIVKSLCIDADGEDFQYIERGTGTAAKDLIDKTWERLAAAAGMPVTRLMGISPGGMNATGESDRTFWYDRVRAYQRQVLKPALEKLVCHVTGGDWEVCFPDLEKQDSLEQAQIMQAQAQSDSAYVTMGALTPSEVAQVRFGRGEWAPGYDGIEMEPHEAAMERELAKLEDGPEQPEQAPADGPGVAASGGDPGAAPGAAPAPADGEDVLPGDPKPGAQAGQ
jgi:phage-related protein (TIGR01555 family)